MNKQHLISEKILATIIERGPEKSVCPSEIARMLFPGHWRSYMQQVREVAIEMQRKGLVIITQKGVPIDINHIKGPIRIKLQNK